MAEIPTVLFVCVHNAGRSQMAAALLARHAAGAVEVRSAGSEPADAVNPAVREAMAELGIDLSAVAPKEVQALMGAMAEKPTATHGYLVTTSWLSPRSRQRARSQRIHTIERNQLASRIKKLLGIDVVISNEPPAERHREAKSPRQSRTSTSTP